MKYRRKRCCHPDCRKAATQAWVANRHAYCSKECLEGHVRMETRNEVRRHAYVSHFLLLVCFLLLGADYADLRARLTKMRDRERELAADLYHQASLHNGRAKTLDEAIKALAPRPEPPPDDEDDEDCGPDPVEPIEPVPEKGPDDGPHCC